MSRRLVSRRLTLVWLWLGAGLLWLIPQAALARDFKVYPYATPTPGEIEAVYWLDYIAASPLKYDYFGKTISKEGLFRHSLELEYGATDRLGLAGYVDLEQPRGEKLSYVQMRAVLLRYRFGEAGQWLMDPAIYLEYYLPDDGYNPSEKLEARLILERELAARWTVILNPIVEKGTSGPDVTEGLEFEYASGLYYRHSLQVTPGLELYGKWGALKRLDRPRHTLMPAVNLRLVKHLFINVGIGFGLTSDTDKVVLKSIIAYEFD